MNFSLKPRHPLLVLIWSLGILVVMNIHQYLGVAIGSWVTGSSFDSIISGKEHSLVLSLIMGVEALLVGIPLAYLAIIFLWRRSLDWMKLRFNWRFVLGGFLFGLVLPVIVLGVISLIGTVNITASPSRLNNSEIVMILIGTTCWMFFIGFSEETVFRGIAVREWAHRWGWKIATILGGLFFGAMHLFGLKGNSFIVSTIWVLIAGTAVTVLFVALYIRSRSLWLPIAFHAGWNLSVQGILGVTISGKKPDFGLFTMEVSGPDWLTGGVFGIEASVVAIVVYIIAAIIILKMFHSKDSQFLNSKP